VIIVTVSNTFSESLKIVVMFQENETWSAAFIDNKRGFAENSFASLFDHLAFLFANTYLTF